MATATADHPLTGDHAELYELWLKPNGIVGWMPENGIITLDLNTNTATWPKWRHLDPESGPWERDLMVRSDLWQTDGPHDSDGTEPIVDMTTVPLAVPYTDRVDELAAAVGLNLVVRL